jgi:4-amino-4-deoxy-L-arabinose transferase-like glycosyltransferase
LRDYLLPAALAGVICAALWPTLGWVEFSSGSEQLVVAAALEAQRSDDAIDRIVPTLNGEPRLRKPPLTTWSAMAVVSHEQAQALASGEVEDAAYRWTAIEIRTVALLYGFALLVGTFELGRLLAGRRVGLIALTVCGSTFFFAEQFIRLTTDATLACFVVWSNVGFAHALLRGRAIAGLGFAGLMLGLGFFAKGPPGLVQTVAPALAALPLVWRTVRDVPVRRWLMGSLAGCALFGAMALPWYGYVLWQVPGAWDVWVTEAARQDRTVPDSDWYAYAVGFALVVPWTPFLVLGLANLSAEVVRRVRPGRLRGFERLRGPGLLYAGLMVLVPIGIMMAFPDRKDRYLLPMLPATAVLIAAIVRLVFRDRCRRPIGAWIMFALHGGIVAVMVVGLPIGMRFLPRDGYDAASDPWLGTGPAVGFALAGLAAVGLLAWLTKYDGLRGFLIGTTTAVMLAANVFLVGYAGSREGLTDLKPIAEAVRREVPDARLWHDPTTAPVAPPGLTIYAARPVRPWTGTVEPGQADVVVFRQRRADRDPVPVPPAGFEPDALVTARRDQSIWWAFVRRDGSE